MIKLVIIGASQLGNFMIGNLLKSNENVTYQIEGYFDEDGPSAIYNEYQINYLGNYKEMIVFPDCKYLLTIEKIQLRLKLAEVISGNGGNFLSYIHPTTYLGKNVTKGEGVFIGPHCFVGDNCHLGSFSILKSKNIIRKNALIGILCLLGENIIIEQGLSLGSGNYLNVDSIIRSFKTKINMDNFSLNELNLENINSYTIPWFSQN
jgi:acetyltransferase-like isoleucine patch superfamily enzyme